MSDIVSDSGVHGVKGRRVSDHYTRGEWGREVDRSEGVTAPDPPYQSLTSGRWTPDDSGSSGPAGTSLSGTTGPGPLLDGGTYSSRSAPLSVTGNEGKAWPPEGPSGTQDSRPPERECRFVGVRKPSTNTLNLKCT